MGYALNFISDGTTEINLLDPKALFVDGWVQKIAQQKGGGYYSGSALADGSELVLESVDNVVEELPLYIRGKDPDQIAAAGQILFDLGYKLRQYWVNGGRQTSPVYWGYRPKDQTNIQYALLKNYRIEPATETHGHSFKGFISKPATFVGTLFLEREPYWRDGIPGTLPTPLSLTHPDAPSMATQLWVPNYRTRFDLTHIYNFDASAGTFSANLAGTASFTYWPASPAINDIIYFGSTTGPFFNIIPFIGTPVNGNVGVIWEIWTGSWTSANSIVDGGDLFTNGSALLRTGALPIRINGTESWTKTAINGVTAYWIRVRINNFVSWTTSPTNTTQAVYTSNDEYIEVDSGDVVGDVPPLLRMLLSAGSADVSGVSGADVYANLVIIGAKSRGLSNFTSRLNAGNSNINPTGWTITLGNDTVDSIDGSSPSGDRAGVNFDTIQSMGERVRWSLSGSSRILDWEGLYEVFLICEQTTGSAGNVSVMVAMINNEVEIHTNTVKMQRVNSGKEIVDLGRLRIPTIGSHVTGSTPLSLQFTARASATNANDTLFIYELVFIPIDESAVAMTDSIVEAGLGSPNLISALKHFARLEFDSGVIRPECAMKYSGSGFTGVSGTLLNQNFEYQVAWFYRGEEFKIVPGRTTRLYFLFGSFPSNETSGSLIWQTGMGAMISIYTHNLWQYLRGSE